MLDILLLQISLKVVQRSHLVPRSIFDITLFS